MNRVVCELGAAILVLAATGWAPGAGARAAGEPATADAAGDPAVDPAVAAAARRRLDALGGGAKVVADAAGRITEVTIADGAAVGPEDVALLGRLTDLRALRIFDCREFDDAQAASLLGLPRLEALALTNSGLTDAGVQVLVQAHPRLVELDLSSNTNLTGAAMKSIAGLTGLKRLTLVQDRFNDLHTRRLARLEQLESLDLRGNMEAGDLTLETLGGLAALRSLKHRSTAVTDQGLEALAAADRLESLLMQDFSITDAAGASLAKLGGLGSLEVFRCQGFGSDGVLALAGLPLTRLTLRDLPNVDDRGLAVLGRLPRLKRLYLHEIASVGDAGLRPLAGARDLELLDIWSLPQLTDAAVETIASLPNLEELSLRETGITQAAVDRLLAMPKLASLTFKNNGPLSAENRARLTARKWKKLDLGADAP